MGLADFFSGGADSAAQQTIKDQLASLDKIQTPTAQQLTLPELQKYVVAGILTPEQAQTYLVNNNAFNGVTADNAGLNTELSTIGQLQNIINQGGNDAQEQADVQGILNQLNTTESGNNAAIVNNNARQGISNSGLTMAAQLAGNQNQATNANKNALDAAANAEARQLGALSSAGTLGGQVQGQQYTAAANKASAANAIEQFNAQQQQQESNINTTAQNAAQAANLENAQGVSNANVATTQKQQESIPAAQQQAYEDALQKAGISMTGAENLAQQQTQEGQQNAGIAGGLLGTAGTLGAAYLTGNPYMALAGVLNQGNSGTPNTNVNTSGNNFTGMVASGGRMTPAGVERPLNMKSGGPVPGQAMVPGDSTQNDTKLAALSPDEIVIPRTAAIPAMQGDTSKVMQFLRSLPKPQMKPAIHPKAVLDTLRALSMHHQGAM